MPLPNLNPNTGDDNKSTSFSGMGLPSLDDDATIESVDIDEMYEEDEEEIEEVVKRKSIPKIDKRKKNRRKTEELFYEEEDEEETEERIDKKRKRIIPTGGEKSMKEIKAKEFDSRKNAATTARAIRAVVTGMFIILFAFGLKNTFFPKNNFSREDIEQMILATTNETGFPIERGRQLVEEFTYELLTTDRSDQAANTRLFKYLSKEKGDESSTQDLSFMNVEGFSQQKVLMKPSVYDITPVSTNVTRYLVTAVVSDDSGDFEESIGSASNDISHRVSLGMTVYYNEENNNLYIVRDTVSLIPNTIVADSSELPDKKDYGTPIDPQNEIVETLRSTVYGFISEYAEASPENKDGLSQYVSSNATSDIYNGFDGGVILNGEPAQAINYKVYEESEGLWKVEAIVSWRDAQASNDSIVYNSRYLLTIEKSGEKNLVSKILPYTYIPLETE